MVNQSSLCNDRFFFSHRIITPLVNWSLFQFQVSYDQLSTSKVPDRSNYSGYHSSLTVDYSVSVIKRYDLAQATLGTQ